VTQYKLNRRTKHKVTGRPLAAYMHDLRIGYDKDGKGAFVDDLNGDPLAFNNFHEMRKFVNEELERNYVAFFGQTP